MLTLENSEKSVVFSVTYAERTRDVVLVDMDSDGCNMCEDLLKHVKRESGSVSTQTLKTPVVFDLASIQ